MESFNVTKVLFGKKFEEGSQLQVSPVLTETPVIFPSQIFEKNKGIKPSIHLPALPTKTVDGQSSPVTALDIGGWILDRMGAAGDIPHPTALLFLDLMSKKIATQATEDWTSYGVSICKKGDSVSPSNLLSPLVETRDINYKSNDPDLTDETLYRILLILLCVPRYRFAQSFNITNYTTTVKNAIGKVACKLIYEGEPTHFEDNLEKVGTASHQLDQDDFLIMVAAYDMFFTKFPGHFLASSRVGTMISYYRDMAALLDLQSACKKMNHTLKALYMTNIVSNCQVELSKMYGTSEEFNTPGSYFPYTRSMKIVEKCPYSVTENPCIHAYYMTFLSLEGDARGMNANLPKDCPANSIMSEAIKIHSLLRNPCIYGRILFESATDLKDYREAEEIITSSSHSKESDPTDPNWILAELTNEYKVPLAKLKAYKNILQRGPQRQGKVGPDVLTLVENMLLHYRP